MERRFGSNYQGILHGVGPTTAKASGGGIFGGLFGGQFGSARPSAPVEHQSIHGSASVSLPEYCRYCMTGQWRHGRCTNHYCGESTRVRNRDRRAAAQSGAMAQLSTIRAAVSESIAEMPQITDPASAATVEPTEETTVESRARHRQSSMGLPVRVTRYDPDGKMTHQWTTTANPDWEDEEDPWLTSTSSSSNSHESTWICHECGLSNESYHRWCNRCWARRIR